MLTPQLEVQRLQPIPKFRFQQIHHAERAFMGNAAHAGRTSIISASLRNSDRSSAMCLLCESSCQSCLVIIPSAFGCMTMTRLSYYISSRSPSMMGALAYRSAEVVLTADH